MRSRMKLTNRIRAVRVVRLKTMKVDHQKATRLAARPAVRQEAIKAGHRKADHQAVRITILTVNTVTYRNQTKKVSSISRWRPWKEAIAFDEQ